MKAQGSSAVGTGRNRELSPAHEEEKFVSFRVGDKRYLIEILRVKEVVRAGKITGIPNSPPEIAGVIDLRGAYVPILDMRARTGLPGAEPSPRARIIVSVVRGRVAGLLVDELLPVMRISASEMKPPPRMAKDLGYDFLTAMCSRGGEVWMLINSDRLLDPAAKRGQGPPRDAEDSLHD
ncbi:MAG: chemotaxis protein CheW [Myxococcota bacterium]